MDNFHSKFNIADLIARHLRNQLSAEEELELERWLDAHPQNLELFNKLINNALDDELLTFYAENHKEHRLENIDEKPGEKKLSPGGDEFISLKTNLGEKNDWLLPSLRLIKA